MCSLSTAIYDLGIQPLAKEMATEGISQIWVVDDLAAAGTQEELKEWYNKMKKNRQKMFDKLLKIIIKLIVIPFIFLFPLFPLIKSLISNVEPCALALTFRPHFRSHYQYYLCFTRI